MSDEHEPHDPMASQNLYLLGIHPTEEHQFLPRKQGSHSLTAYTFRVVYFSVRIGYIPCTHSTTHLVTNVASSNVLFKRCWGGRAHRVMRYAHKSAKFSRRN